MFTFHFKCYSGNCLIQLPLIQIRIRTLHPVLYLNSNSENLLEFQSFLITLIPHNST